MKKRIFSLLTALLLVLSAFVLAGCPAQEAEVSESESEAEKPLTPKELFSASLSNALSAENSNATSQIMNKFNGKDTVTDMKLEFTELNIIGVQDIAALGAIKAEFTVSSDLESQRSSMDGSFSMFGETMPLSGLIDAKEDKMFITDLCGVYDKTVMAPMDAAGNIESAGSSVTGMLDYYNSGTAEEIGNHVIATVQKVIGENIDDSVYAMEAKDVTVEGKEFKGAQVITLTLTGEKIETIAVSFIDEMFKNETFKSFIGDEISASDFTKEIKDAVSEVASVVITNTVVENKTVALDIVATEAENADDADDSAVSDNAEASEDEEDDGIDTFAAKFSKVDSEFTFNLGYIDENGFIADKGYLTVKNSGSNGNYELTASFTEGDETETYLTVKTEGTVTEDKFDGTVSAEIEDNKISIKVVAENGETTGKLAISDIKVTTDGTTTDIPLSLSLVYTVEENKMTYGGDISLTVEGAISLKANMDCTVEIKDVTLEAVTDYVNIEDVDGEALSLALAEKYPTILSFIESIGGSQGESGYYDEQYFERNGFGIWLPEGFAETDSEGFDIALQNENVGIFALEQEYDELTDIEDLADYAEAVYAGSTGDNLSDIQIYEGMMPYFEYTYDVDGVTYSYLVAMWDGSDGYWMIIFGCEEELYDSYYYDFLDWAWYCDTYADAE